MLVVLNKDTRGLGRRGEMVDVKTGYFRNFLFPRGIAQLMTPSLEKVVEARKKAFEAEKAQLIEKAEELVEKLDGKVVSVKSKATETGKLYASVNTLAFVEAVESQHGITLDESFLKMNPVKMIGEYDITVEFDLDHSCKMKLKVSNA